MKKKLRYYVNQKAVEKDINYTYPVKYLLSGQLLILILIFACGE